MSSKSRVRGRSTAGFPSKPTTPQSATEVASLTHLSLAPRHAQASLGGKDQTRLRIERMEAEREERRRAVIARKEERAREKERNIAAGNPGDVDFIGMVRAWRQEHAREARPSAAAHPRICIAIRKRPVSDKERARNDHDSVTCLNPAVWIHSAKFRVDGITKYLDHARFEFDHAFDERASNEDVYSLTTLPLLEFCCSGTGGRATVFAYGQTGSGKTHSMQGIQELLCQDLFLLLADSSPGGGRGCSSDDTVVMVSFFEMYGGYIQDLLNERNRLKVLEDGKGEVVITGLHELEADNAESLKNLLDAGNNARTTHTTEANDTSSRSHAICQIVLRDRDTKALRGKLSLVDLAGSERGTDTKCHNQQRRAESADINTSLLALKECIRALDRSRQGNMQHVPYRASKLTMVLKDCFDSDKAMTTMIATVSPGASAADHSLNTLRYADRVKEKRSSDHNPDITKQRTSRPSRPRQSTTTSLEGCDPLSALSDPDLQEKNISNLLEEPTEPQSLVSQDDMDVRREEILNQHMENIRENAEMLSEEGQLLQIMQGSTVTTEDLDDYVAALEKFLERKEDMILGLQKMILELQERQ